MPVRISAVANSPQRISKAADQETPSTEPPEFQYDRDFHPNTTTRIIGEGFGAGHALLLVLGFGRRDYVSVSDSCSIVGRSAVLQPVAGCSPLRMKIGNVYCRLFHQSISHPVNGKYRCWRCLREFQLEW